MSITEAMLGDAMQQAYVNGGSPTMWIVPPGPKRTISTFTGRSTSQVLVGKTEVVSTIDVIATDFGRVIHLHRRSTSQVLVGKTEVVSTIDVIATDFHKSRRRAGCSRMSGS